MTVVALIQLLLLGNMALFLLSFSMLAQPPGLIDRLVQRFQAHYYDADPEVIEAIVRQLMRFVGILSLIAVFGWAAFSAFVVSLYRSGYFWRL